MRNEPGKDLGPVQVPGLDRLRGQLFAKIKKINQINLRHSLGHLSEAEKVFGSTNC